MALIRHPRDPEDPPVGARLDPRVQPIVHHRETRPLFQRRQHKTNRVRVHGSRRNGRARWAREIIADWGDPDCPRGEAPSAALFREARNTLGWSQPEAAWRLGFESRSVRQIVKIERGAGFAPRHARLLMLAALQRLADQQQAAVFHGGN